MKNNYWKTNYLADFEDNSYLLLSSLQDRATEYIMNHINPHANVCNLFKIFCNIFSYSLLNFSNDILLSDCPTKEV